MAAVTPVALDHSFPEPLLRDVARWMPASGFHWIKNQPPHDLNRLEDHVLEGAGDDPASATGVLLRDLRDLFTGSTSPGRCLGTPA